MRYEKNNKLKKKKLIETTKKVVNKSRKSIYLSIKDIEREPYAVKVACPVREHICVRKGACRVSSPKK